ncbi:PREDICTED: putative upstream-binding factor 1-like protein 1 [Galeopterus variegatus]|uniref:Upstream-binding factor 1-like protein 1 n=1 Tax=Galeopterus variegatus TaxID=482537 RepID=A0ABM0Q1D1_GALVR|nr:PREDICTED: putative upstream-binding factor 1-like protein 1 [Galeopterus variegatus]
MVLPRGQDHWSNEDILSLLESMENNLLFNNSHLFKTTQSHLYWEKVAFKDFSGEICKLKWLEISVNLKFHALKELVLEAKEHIKNTYKSKNCKKHPDFPKKPLTAYNHFVKENWPQYSQRNPELTNQELNKLLSEKYKELPKQIKQKYIEDFQKGKQEFEGKLAQFRKDHPDLVEDSKNSGVPKRSQIKTQQKFQRNVKEVRSPSETDEFSKKMKFHGEPWKPPMNGYHKFHQHSWSSRELQHLTLRQRMVETGRCWQRIPQGLKEHYSSQAEELQKQYKVDLDLWLKSLSPKEYVAYKEATYTKRKNRPTTGGPNPKFRRTNLQSLPAKSLQEGLGKEQGLEVLGTASPENFQVNYHPSWGSEENKKEDGEEDDGSEDEGEEDESEGSGSSSSSSGDSDSVSI